MKLLRRNNLNRSKQIGLIAFAFAVLLFVFFFQNVNEKESKQNATQIEIAEKNNKAS